MLRAENASLKPHADRFHALYRFWFFASRDPVIMLDHEGKVNGTNPAGERLLGTTSVAMAGRPLTSFLREDCPALSAVKRMIETGNEIRDERVRVKPVSARETDAELTGKFFRDSEAEEWWVILKPL